LIVWFPRFSCAFKFIFFKVRVKCIKWNFFSENKDLWRFAYVSHVIYIYFNIMQFCFVDELYIKIFISFTKPVALVCSCIFSQVFNRSVLYIKYKIGEINKFCEISVETLFFNNIKLFIRSFVDLSVKKLWIQRINNSEILFFYKLYKSLACDT
jgi:hypothetical protein